ncbi:MAG: hypothetical protein MRY79_00285 [Alphaproteobacteria bacterium]|nr:hypothetical protein [Alphaproteobacteria bacterium]
MGSTHDQPHCESSSIGRRIGKRIKESGNIFLTLFGAIGMVGVIGASTMTVMQGPVKTMSEVTKRTVAENNMIAAGKLALMASINQTNPNCDTDVQIEPLEMSATTITGFTGGSEIPATIGTTKEDSWGMPFGYCSWDHGTDVDAGGCAGDNRRAGADVSDQYVLAIISAGPDGIFETTCNDYVDADTNNEPDVPLVNKTSGADDLVMGYTYEEATAMSGGLWNLADPDTAEIAKDISIKDSGGTEQFAFDSSGGNLAIGGTGDIPSVNTDFINNLNNASIDIVSPVTTDDITSSGDVGAVNITASGNLQGGATTVSSLDAGSGAIQTTGTLNAGTTVLGGTTTSSLNAGSGAIQTTGTLNAGTTTLGSTTVSSLDAGSGAIQTTGTLNAGTTTLGNTSAGTLASSGLATLDSLAVTNTTSLNGPVNLGDAPADILTVNGTLTFTSDLDMGSGTNKIIDLGTPTDPNDATTKAYVDAAVAAGTGYTETDPQVDDSSSISGRYCTWDGSKVVCTAMVSDDDTLGSLTCTDGQVAKWNNGGSVWECADDTGGSGGGGGLGGVLSNGEKNGGTAASVSESITIAEDGILIGTAYANGSCNPSSQSNKYVEADFRIDGAVCNRNRDRMYVNNASTRTSTTCIKELAAGTYTISAHNTDASGCSRNDVDMHWTVFSKAGGGGSGGGSGGGGLGTPDFDGGWQSSWSFTSGRYSVAHGLGTEPIFVIAQFRTKSAFGGYGAGEIIQVTSNETAHRSDINQWLGESISFDSTNIYLNSYSGFYYNSPTNIGGINDSSFDMRIIAWDGSSGSGGSGGGTCEPAVAPSGWPDAITCAHAVDSQDAVFYFMGNSSTGDTDIYYASSGSYLIFNDDKSYDSNNNANVAGSCVGQSITDLETAGQTSNFCSGGSGGSGGTDAAIAPTIRTENSNMPMAPDGNDWADAIVCTGSNSQQFVLPLFRYIESTSQVMYRYEHTGTDYSVFYNTSTGARVSGSGDGAFNGGTDCPSTYAATTKSYFGGGSGGSGGSGTAIIDTIAASGVTVASVTIAETDDKWPDYFSCDDGADVQTLILSRYNNGDQVRYLNTSEGNYYTFNSDGTYYNSASVDANCGASAGDIDTICSENRCGFFGGGSGGSGGGSGGSGGGSGDPIYTYCTNENSDGDTTDDKAACVGAATNTSGTDRYRAVSCAYNTAGNQMMGGWLNWTGTAWQNAYSGTWYNCVDGTLVVVDTQATTGGGGSDTLAGLSCTDGQVAAWNDTGSVWECADAGSGGSGSTMVDGWPDAINCTRSGAPNEYFYYLGTSTGSTVGYFNVYSPTNTYVYFNTDGTYSSSLNTDAVCQVDMSVLEAADRTHNFVGGGSGGSGGGGSGTAGFKALDEELVAGATFSSAPSTHSWPVTGVPSDAYALVVTFVRTGTMNHQYMKGYLKQKDEADTERVQVGSPQYFANYETNEATYIIPWNPSGTQELFLDQTQAHYTGGTITVRTSGAFYGGGGGGADNLGDHTATQDIDVDSNDVININMLEFDAVAGDSPISNSDTLTGLSCTDGQVAAWNNGGGYWECANQSGGSDDLGNHTATQDIDMATFDVENITRTNFAGTAGDAPISGGGSGGGSETTVVDKIATRGGVSVVGTPTQGNALTFNLGDASGVDGHTFEFIMSGIRAGSPANASLAFRISRDGGSSYGGWTTMGVTTSTLSAPTNYGTYDFSVLIRTDSRLYLQGISRLDSGAPSFINATGSYAAATGDTYIQFETRTGSTNYGLRWEHFGVYKM